MKSIAVAEAIAPWKKAAASNYPIFGGKEGESRFLWEKNIAIAGSFPKISNPVI